MLKRVCWFLDLCLLLEGKRISGCHAMCIFWSYYTDGFSFFFFSGRSKEWMKYCNEITPQSAFQMDYSVCNDTAAFLFSLVISTPSILFMPLLILVLNVFVRLFCFRKPANWPVEVPKHWYLRRKRWPGPYWNVSQALASIASHAKQPKTCFPQEPLYVHTARTV